MAEHFPKLLASEQKTTIVVTVRVGCLQPVSLDISTTKLWLFVRGIILTNDFQSPASDIVVRSKKFLPATHGLATTERLQTAGM